ncbi:MAG: tRNA 2-thiouridine(34) synthase MnmA [Phycisphaerales bacterium]|nr:tRNA 2-thiouridine(34) synthase MnmA [Phycisphaerales bacterium]
MPSRPKVLLAMSGGVDSSVAAALLLREGYEVVGCFMRLGSPGESLDELQPDATPSNGTEGPGCGGARLKIGHQGCCSINDAADARLVAAKLDIPFYVCNFKKDFGRIIDHFVAEYNAGRTPNPCVRCNDWLKFGKLHEYATQIDAQFVASGHYARVEHDPVHGRHRLLRGIDLDKDQSYVLFGVRPDRLARTLLPIGGLRKPEVRALARELDLPVFDKPDSQEICFVPDNDYAGLIARRTPEAVKPGAVLDGAGRVVGEHPGQQHFTIGQRRRVGVALGHPIYVVDRDPEANTITVGPRDALDRDACVAREANWLVDPATIADHDGWIRCQAKIRYNSPPVAARVRTTGDASIEVRFDKPQFAIAPGQAVVCYDGEVVIGGAWIA